MCGRSTTLRAAIASVASESMMEQVNRNLLAIMFSTGRYRA